MPVGRATAARLLEEGSSVVLSSRRQEVLDAARSELDPTGERIALLADDVSSPTAAERLIGAARSTALVARALGLGERRATSRKARDC